MTKKYFLYFLLVFLLTSFISAAVITDDLHLNIQTTNSAGSVVTGTFNFVFNISTSSDCANIIYSNSTNLTTDSRGIVSYYLPNVTLNYSEQYWLCYYRDGTLINASKIARVPYTFTAKNISAEGIKNDSNLNLVGFNITSSSGLFSWLGSLTSRIAELFIQNISFIGNINGSGNITTTGRATFGTLNVTGTSYLGNIIISADNITVNNILNKSQDNVRIWSKLLVDNNVGIGTASPSSHKLNVVGTSNFTDNATFEKDVKIGGNSTVGGTINATGEIYNKGASILPIGTILMYDGTGIADVGLRTEDIGSRAGDTISLPGWKVANGFSGTPNLTNSFIRGMTSSGSTGGSDNAMAHTHAFTQPSSHAATATTRTTDVALSAHSITQPTFTYPDHKHQTGYYDTANNFFMYDSGGAGSRILSRTLVATTSGTIRMAYFYDVPSAIRYFYTLTDGGGSTTRTTDVAVASHTITQPTFNTPVLSHTGGAVGAVSESTTGQNMPRYYSVIFIKRVS